MGVVRIGDARVSNARVLWELGNSPMEMIVIPQQKKGDETATIIIGTCLGLKFFRIRQEGGGFQIGENCREFGLGSVPPLGVCNAQCPALLEAPLLAENDSFKKNIR